LEFVRGSTLAASRDFDGRRSQARQEGSNLRMRSRLSYSLPKIAIPSRE
jgi:hypothetical protein